MQNSTFHGASENRSFFVHLEKALVIGRRFIKRCLEAMVVVIETVSLTAAVAVFTAFVIHEVIKYIKFLF
jgi:hypothetical protein